MLQCPKSISLTVSCKFEMFIFKIAVVIKENDIMRFVFLYILSILCIFWVKFTAFKLIAFLFYSR